jgi:outer membrane protein assembly factor BamE (lipoprotein component of BamABCDE complex)
MFLLPLWFGLPGCAAVPVPPADVERIRRGMTMAEVRAILGPPHHTEPSASPVGEAWTYRSQAPGGSPHRVTFDVAGRVEQIVVVSGGR